MPLRIASLFLLLVWAGAETYCWMFTNPLQTPTVITLNLQLNPN
jgi:hypothetical protein